MSHNESVVKDSTLMDDLLLLLNKHSNGRDISDLDAYEQK